MAIVKMQKVCVIGLDREKEEFISRLMDFGVVELTVAIHRVFDTSRDRLVFDVGHQCYVHKMLTGRMDRFDTLRQQGGISGFPKPCESVHDAFIAGHASNAVSVALGMARARTLSGDDYHVLALLDRKSTRLNSSHSARSRMPSSA